MHSQRIFTHELWTAAGPLGGRARGSTGAASDDHRGLWGSGDLYADGIRQGAPQAVQVVDRFHLAQNLRQALEAFLIDHRSVLQAATVGAASALTPADGHVSVMPMYRGRRRHPTPAPQEEAERPPRHPPWVATYETLHRLHAQGTSIATMARQLGISRPTVYAYLRHDAPPGPRRLRRAADAGHPPESQRSPYVRPQGPPARAVSFVMVSPAVKRSHGAQAYLDQLCQMDFGI